jgi:hypothetical protein
MRAAEKEDIDQQFVEKYCSTTIEGISRLCDWLITI